MTVLIIVVAYLVGGALTALAGAMLDPDDAEGNAKAALIWPLAWVAFVFARIAMAVARRKKAKP